VTRDSQAQAGGRVNAPKPKHVYRRLFAEARPFSLHIAGLLVLSVLSALCTLLIPVPLKIAVDNVIGTHPLPGLLDSVLPNAVSGSTTGILVFAVVVLVLIMLLKQLVQFGNLVLSTYAGQKLLLSFRARLFRHVQRLSLAYHDMRGVTDSTYRIQYDAQSLQTLAIAGVIPFVTAAFTVIGMLYVTAMIDWRLGLIAATVAPPLLVTFHLYKRRLRRQWHEAKRLESSALSVVHEALSALRVVKAFGQEDHERERFLGRSGESMRVQVGLSFVEGSFGILIGLIMALGMAAVLFVGTRSVQSGTLTVGDLVLVMTYIQQLYDPLQTISKKAGTLQSSLASAERVFSLLDEAPDLVEARHARSLKRAEGGVAFQDVSFAYDAAHPVLRDVSFKLAPGTRVGIAGATGAGKTTLVSLLTRFYDPTSGRIMLDGVDLREYRLADLRNQFGIVLQEPVLFSTSIAENIAYARPGASEAEIRAAAAAANAHDFIVELPDGYATPVGERGMRLSGGERQRISLARAFLKNAPILILDEPTSSVDVHTEAVIMEAMERLMSGRTNLMIAHRLSTLDVCERRLEIEHGRLVEVGPAKAAGGRVRRVNGARAGKAASSPPAPEVIRSHLEGHQAAKAWGRLHPDAEPRALTVLKRAKPKRKSAIFRLEGCGPEGASVIAKLCRRNDAKLESRIYAEVLPRFPVASLRCHGTLDEDAERAWIFLEDAGDERYSPLNPEHRRLAARWLAALHGFAAGVPEASHLPDRGPAQYLAHLRSARMALHRQLHERSPGGAELHLLTTLVFELDVVESRWDVVRAFCKRLPRTLVHCDLSRSNLRVRAGESGMELVAFDWEKAGWGVPPPDLARLQPHERRSAARFKTSGPFYGFCADPCLETYRSALRDGYKSLRPKTVERMANVGTLFQCLATIDWWTRRFTPDFTPTTQLAMCSLWLSNAIQVAGWTGGSSVRR
jgi:ATP-binding cassette, subfamily B, bacterial